MANSKSSGLRAIIVFLTITFILSSIVWILTANSGTTGPFGNRVYGYGIMWCPALAAYITCKILGRNISDLAWQWGNYKYILWSFLVPLLYGLVAYSAVWLCGGGGFYNKVYIEQMAHELGWEKIPANVFLILFLLLQGSIGMIASMSTALGEEIGWRGFLIPELADQTKSYTRTSLIAGIIMALWHFPLILFGSYNHGAPSWFSLVTFTAAITAASFIFTWFRLKSNSLWTAVVLHASHNLFIQGFFDPITIEYPHTKYFTGEFGMAVPIVSILLAIYFWSRRKELPGLTSSK
ncbi:CPBP family intramembrane glutamic endopeptidase [Chryseobacterium paridis]|uniref:CPBP family intramembrane metalloprotease n=1 Tax=Chryseobacterium paridis TaxID=2800328 RepID=A0ABS1FVB8_9FLAO|nr:CPBP family intramembrane glutamic endopeptidase [Chryseobacterium paridis]MBK1896164.1 CPBP family intramembrane metalloprotease [Chryseobacterium paridis]